MSAIALRRSAPPYRKGWCPGALKPMETGDGLLARVRAPRGRLSLDQAVRAGGRRHSLRQRRDRPLGARQSSPARFDRANAARPACAPRRQPGSSTPTPRSSVCATLSQARSTTSILKLRSISDRASPRWRRGSGRTSACGACRRSSASSSTRRGACRSAISTRTSASRRRAAGRSRFFSPVRTRWPRSARRMRSATSRRGLAGLSSP